MKTPITLVIAALALLAGLTGCARKNDTPDAIKQGVIRDISKSFKMDSMDVTVDSVSFRDKEADATVTFSLKGGSKDQGMTMKYVMERHDDNQWYIKRRAANSAPVGGDAAGAMPAGHPSVEAPGAAGGDGTTALPAGHPQTGQKQ